MIKRMSKATSILVAAAAVVSLIPATGVSAATQQLETKSGTIENAIAFSGGKYLYDGYKSDNDQTAVYYNDGTADKQVEDFSADSMTKFSNGYATVTNGSDEYLVDLSNGTVSDDTASDKADTVKTRLKSTLSKTDRYGTMDTTDKFTRFNQVAQGQFGDTWYSYSVTTSGGANYSGYVSDSGKYIDADDTANIVVKDGTNDKTIKVSEFGKANSGSNIIVTKDDSKTKDLAEDSDYIYREITVNISGSTTPSAVYIQKISKAQGTTKDGAYLPNSVTSYEVSSAYNSSDATDAATAINEATDFRVINGVLYATKNAGDKVTVTTIKLKQDKVALTSDTTNTKLDVNLAEQDVQKDYDIEASSAVSIDVDGNTWAVDKGEVVKFDGTDFVPVYSVDRSFDSLDVYNADSLITWANGQDAYATVDNQDTTNTGTGTDTGAGTGTTVTAGWVKNADGTWSYNKADGTKTTGWVQDGNWYYLNANGIMATGWVNDNGTWYYLADSGAMKTGWVNDNGTWYYLAGSGAMKTGWINDNGTWYYLKSSGAMATGWVNDNGTWYYLNASGAMLANTTVDGYKLGASGAWIG